MFFARDFAASAQKGRKHRIKVFTKSSIDVTLEVLCVDFTLINNGTQQTLPRLDDERRANLYDRANHFRRNSEFDKAMSIYEQILSEDTTVAEAYWSIVLCRYGIEYVTKELASANANAL